jgi:hypothetical protein
MANADKRGICIRHVTNLATETAADHFTHFDLAHFDFLSTSLLLCSDFLDQAFALNRCIFQSVRRDHVAANQLRTALDVITLSRSRNQRDNFVLL